MLAFSSEYQAIVLVAPTGDVGRVSSVPAEGCPIDIGGVTYVRDGYPFGRSSVGVMELVVPVRAANAADAAQFAVAAARANLAAASRENDVALAGLRQHNRNAEQRQQDAAARRKADAAAAAGRQAVAALVSGTLFCIVRRQDINPMLRSDKCHCGQPIIERTFAVCIANGRRVCDSCAAARPELLDLSQRAELDAADDREFLTNAIGDFEGGAE
jgi:hypothetical protein